MDFKRVFILILVFSGCLSFSLSARSAESQPATDLQLKPSDSEVAKPPKGKVVPKATKPQTEPQANEDVLHDNPEAEEQEDFKKEELPTIEAYKELPNGEELRLGIKDCVQMALLNNREIKAQNYAIDGAEWKLKEAQPKGIPVFEYEFLSAPAPRDVDEAVESFFNGNITYFQKGHIGMGIPLTSFGKIHMAQDLAKSGISAEKEKKIEKQNEVVLNVHKFFYGLLLAKDVDTLLNDALNHMDSEILRRETGSAGPRKAGAKPNPNASPADPVELVKLKLFRYEILKRLGEAHKKAELAREGLRIYMGLKRGTEYSINEEHLEAVNFDLKDFDFYLEQSQKFRPKNRLVDIGLKATENNLRLEKRKIAPDVGIGGFFEFGVTTNSITGLVLTDDFNDPFNFRRLGFGLRIKGELNVNEYRSKVHQAQAEYYKTVVSKSAADDGLILDLKEAYLNVQQGRRDMDNADSAMKLARQYVFVTKTNMDIGVGDKKDYSDALQAYLIARGQYLQTVFEYNVAVATLEDRVGGVALFQ